MTTTLYFQANTVSDYSTGNNDAMLNGSTSGWTARVLGSAVNFFSTLSAVTVAGPTNGIEVLSSSFPAVWYTAPLAATVTISGSITWNLWAAEATMSDNVAINGRLEVVDGATGAITLIDQTARTTEVALTTPAVNNFAETPAAGVVCKKGDRLRVRVFGDDAGVMAAAGRLDFTIGSTTPGANGDSFLTLTETLTFVSEPAGTQVFPTDTASAVTSSPATLLSNFTGADENPLSESGNWANLNTAGNPLKRVSNQATSATGIGISYWTGADFGPDVEAYVSLPTVGNSVRVLARIQGAGGSNTWDGYSVEWNGSTSVFIYRNTNGGDASLAPTITIAALTANAKIGIACHGSIIEAWVQPSGGSWQKVASVVDTTYASAGKVALVAGGTTVQLDDFYAATTIGGSFSGGLTEREAWTSRGAGVQTDVTNTVAGWTAPIQVTDTAGGTVVDWFTRPLTAFTLGGAVRCNVRMSESNAAANVSGRVQVAVTANDGTGAVVWATGVPPSEVSTSETILTFLISGDDLAVTTGQRLRIRFYIDDTGSLAMGTSQTATMFYAGAVNATGDTWLKFTQTLTEAISAYQPRHGFVNHQNPGVL